MLLSHNPPPEGVKYIIDASKHKAAKWIKDSQTGEMWYWPAECETHANVAKALDISEYTKGISIPKEE